MLRAKTYSHPKKSHPKDISGRVVGRLLVTEGMAITEDGRARWLCLCDCGTSTWILAQALNGSLTKSCGCYARDYQKTPKNGAYSGGKKTPEYSSWRAMLSRCLSPKCRCYKNYGGRGIEVCAAWLGDFSQFKKDMGIRPPGTSIERRDNNLGYFKENCYWATPKQQARNTSKTRNLTFNGETLCVKAWSEKLGIHPATIQNRLRKNWPLDRVFAKPITSKGS